MPATACVEIQSDDDVTENALLLSIISSVRTCKWSKIINYMPVAIDIHSVQVQSHLWIGAKIWPGKVKVTSKGVYRWTLSDIPAAINVDGQVVVRALIICHRRSFGHPKNIHLELTGDARRLLYCSLHVINIHTLLRSWMWVIFRR